MIPYNDHFLAPKELQYASESLRSGHIGADGPFTTRATNQLKKILGAESVMLTTSCTHALELSALLHELGPDDEVVMPSFTFASTANAVTLRGATIRFADVSKETFSMELPELQGALTEKTTAVIAVHYGGVSRDIAETAAFCKKSGYKFIEDNAHGLFATHRDKALGCFAPLAALSFHVTKNISVGVAGALVINDASYLARAEVLRDKGTNRAAFMRGEVDHYTWQGMGSAYAPADYVAAVLLAQLEHADFIQARRNSIVDIYREHLSPYAQELGFALQTVPEHTKSSAHLFPVYLQTTSMRDPVLKQMKLAGVHCTSHYEPLHLAYKGKAQQSLPFTETLSAGLIRLPLHPALSDEQANEVALAFISTLKSIR
ncbi:MAG: dTDP-4-amino-4,6-dideoxygalactose transaminase [Myxococcales bacterium]|nr:MAG: dTDP-4-amino-4,6-dideoxygalactose transaminase [Myxococcales bacterium]